MTAAMTQHPRFLHMMLPTESKHVRVSSSHSGVLGVTTQCVTSKVYTQIVRHSNHGIHVQTRYITPMAPPRDTTSPRSTITLDRVILPLTWVDTDILPASLTSSMCHWRPPCVTDVLNASWRHPCVTDDLHASLSNYFHLLGYIYNAPPSQ